MQKNRDEQIRDRAFALWEAEGRPEGKHAEHWYQAERDLGEQPTEGPARDNAYGDSASVDEAAPDDRADPLENPASETLRTSAEPGSRDDVQSTPDSLPRNPAGPPD